MRPPLPGRLRGALPAKRLLCDLRQQVQAGMLVKMRLPRQLYVSAAMSDCSAAATTHENAENSQQYALESAHPHVQHMYTDFKPVLLWPQLYDVMLLEHKPLVEVTNQELAEAPLLFLACGHIFPRDSLDGLVELGKAYSADDAGRWLPPLPLQVGANCAIQVLGLVPHCWVRSC